MDPDDVVAGAYEIRKMYLGMGVKVPEILLSNFIDIADAEPEKKELWREQLREAMSVIVPCCIDIKGVTSNYKIAFDECDRNHDFGLELNKLYSQTANQEEKEKVLGYVTLLFDLGKHAYFKVLKDNRELIDEVISYIKPGSYQVGEKNPDEIPEVLDPMTLRINPNNTTYYVVNRYVGIFAKDQYSSSSEEEPSEGESSPTVDSSSSAVNSSSSSSSSRGRNSSTSGERYSSSE